MKMNYKLAGLHCEHCVNTVQAALKSLRGVSSASVALDRAEVEFDETHCRPADVVRAIRSAGAYDVTGFAPASP